jgi:segregation and condensation protein A
MCARIALSWNDATGAAMTDYKVKFEVFEGPLDLLLYLIKKEEVDIYEVNLTQLATQFIEYIEVMRLLDLDIAGEFLVMASTLMYIKSRELLPVEQQVVPEDEDEGEDPRWELIRQLVEYKKFKDAAAQLHLLEVRQESVFPRIPGKPEFAEDLTPQRGQASLFDLINAVNVILKRVTERTDLRDIFEDKWTVSEKIESIRQRITTGRVRFSSLFADATSRTEVVVTFLAMLELIRLRIIQAMQESPFAEIELWQAPPIPPEPAAAPVPETGTDYAAAVAAEAAASREPAPSALPGSPAPGADHDDPPSPSSPSS